jgi:hypothetical protein
MVSVVKVWIDKGASPFDGEGEVWAELVMSSAYYCGSSFSGICLKYYQRMVLGKFAALQSVCLNAEKYCCPLADFAFPFL